MVSETDLNKADLKQLSLAALLQLTHCLLPVVICAELLLELLPLTAVAILVIVDCVELTLHLLSVGAELTIELDGGTTEGGAVVRSESAPSMEVLQSTQRMDELVELEVESLKPELVGAGEGGEGGGGAKGECEVSGDGVSSTELCDVSRSERRRLRREGWWQRHGQHRGEGVVEADLSAEVGAASEGVDELSVASTAVVRSAVCSGRECAVAWDAEEGREGSGVRMEGVWSGWGGVEEGGEPFSRHRPEFLFSY